MRLRLEYSRVAALENSVWPHIGLLRHFPWKPEREFLIDDQLVRIHLIMSEMFLVDLPRAMGV